MTARARAAAARFVLIGAPELAVLSARRRAPAAVDLAALTPAVLERLNPQALGIAVFAADPDAFQALSRLARLGYRGRVLAFAPPLPRRKLVERELRAHAPGLRVRVVCLLALGCGLIMAHPQA
jgi:hypothetical protein